MPTVRIELEDADVKAVLQKLGYGFNLNRNYAIQLTVADPQTRRGTGHYARKKLNPITKAQYSRILKFCETPVEAAKQVVALSHGRTTDPDLPAEHAAATGGAGQLDAAGVQALVQSAVANELDRVTAPLRQEIADANAKVEQLDGALSVARKENKGLREKAAALLKTGKGKKGQKADAAPVAVEPPPAVPLPAGGSRLPLDDL
jgi:hypothetical protein